MSEKELGIEEEEFDNAWNVVKRSLRKSTSHLRRSPPTPKRSSTDSPSRQDDSLVEDFLKALRNAQLTQLKYDKYDLPHPSSRQKFRFILYDL